MTSQRLRAEYDRLYPPPPDVPVLTQEDLDAAEEHNLPPAFYIGLVLFALAMTLVASGYATVQYFAP